MAVQSRPGFHSGELATQRQAGVEADAARLAPMMAGGVLRAGMAAFLSEAPFAAIAARDATGRLWTSPLLGPPGFLRAASPTTLQIRTSPPSADPLHGLPSGQPVGLIAMNFLTRRRARINGRLVSTEGGLTVDIDQAYGNCPQYIQQRRIQLEGTPGAGRVRLYEGNALRPSDIRLIENADTFFLGTSHVASGNDASHRGGPPGFVRVEPGELWWPDYPGNNMFNSLGNLSADPTAALLFLDFRAGIAVQLSGSASVRWSAPGDAGETGRRVHFVPRRVISTALPGVGETDHAPYPRNPPLSR
ncbi:MULTISPECIES: pyridoxamine 5'-phosphate oxidase family protein [unclassified Mycobacterium]|uniref:pyridoxamine 5'-phosphate oxidase family protein n=1 Tax=unclassified Mycobacterium TaxID=2642494 RepID=UPI0008019CF9|nr:MULTISPECIES: pyridoxamine 5'-phosphate oxidase family protein [unclassified Mycobacterium]OBH04204.1 pyridoxamine 5'-phosphate oxidase [Mycobacterium sp. E2699]OBI51488.1 pyridoxamine 5'-phosphate oxidase [Mycobacterium sp. E787]